jgi:hypothetical protein
VKRRGGALLKLSVAVLALVALGCGSDRSGGGGGGGGASPPSVTADAGGPSIDGGKLTVVEAGAIVVSGGECVDFSHAEALWGPPRDLRVVGTGVAAYEGENVRLVLTQNGEPTYKLAQTVVTNGTFELALAGAVSHYTGMGVYIDRGKDDACTMDIDPSWQRTTGADNGPVRWDITPNAEQPAGAVPCDINGIFDIKKTLHCAP